MRMTCPRRMELPAAASIVEGEDTWIHGKMGTCSWCGSINPDELLAKVEAGEVSLGPTDKNYKAYVHNDDGAWLGKVYFQHFTDDQCRRFIQMLNQKLVKFGEPGYFYVLPFFAVRAG